MLSFIFRRQRETTYINLLSMLSFSLHKKEQK